jgi:hypothetical protein
MYLALLMLVSGSMMIFFAAYLPSGIFPSLTVYTGFFLLLGSPLLITLLAMLTLLPGAAKMSWVCGE